MDPRFRGDDDIGQLRQRTKIGALLQDQQTSMDPRFRGDDGIGQLRQRTKIGALLQNQQRPWIPAFARMTAKEESPLA